MEEIVTQASQGADSGLLGVYGELWVEILAVIFFSSALSAGFIEPIARHVSKGAWSDLFKTWLLRVMSVAVGAGLGALFGESVLTPGLDLLGSIGCGAAGGGAYTFFLPVLKSLISLRVGTRLPEGEHQPNDNGGEKA